MKTIKIHDKTHKELENLFVGRDTFDGVINCLIVNNKALDHALKNLEKDDRERIKKKMEANYEKLL